MMIAEDFLQPNQRRDSMSWENVLGRVAFANCDPIFDGVEIKSFAKTLLENLSEDDRYRSIISNLQEEN